MCARAKRIQQRHCETTQSIPDDFADQAETVDVREEVESLELVLYRRLQAKRVHSRKSKRVRAECVKHRPSE